MKTLLILTSLLTGCSQLSPDHGRERIFTLGIGVVDRVTTVREAQNNSYFNTPPATLYDTPSAAHYNK